MKDESVMEYFKLYTYGHAALNKCSYHVACLQALNNKNLTTVQL